ncbi:MAG: zinc ribbon domain-containing protein, partial [Armatimonadota bacterium]|nr:zinc ribbon domain-containing protein [Armatimonadota bacterium]
MQCPQCRSEVKEGARFCWRCGATMPNAQAPAPAPAAPVARADTAQRGNPWIFAFAAAALLILLLVFLLLRSQVAGGKLLTRAGGNTPASNSVAAGTANVPIAPTSPLTAVPGNDVSAPPLVSAEPGNIPAAPGLPGGVPADPRIYRDDVAAYLKKLEA